MASVTLLTLLAGCSSTGPSAPGGILAEHGLADKDAVQIIDQLDRLNVNDRPSDFKASVRPDELLLSDDDSQVALELPDDRFYLSVEPYVTNTHDCFYHSLTTCKGELGGKDVRVTVTDEAGKVLLEDKSTTFDNGFLGLWLPRDVAGTIEMEYDDMKGKVDFSTDNDAPTCLTTLQLA